MAAGGVNKAILVGHVTRDPEIRTTKAGIPQAAFTIATSEIWFDKPTNERREKTVYHKIVVYAGPLVNVVEKCVRAGARVYIEGSIEVRRWVGKDGQGQNWTCEVVVQGWSGRLTVLDFADELARAEPEDLEESESTPLSIARSHAKYGDDTDDTERSGLSRFLQTTPDDADRARLRAAGEPDRRRD